MTLCPPTPVLFNITVTLHSTVGLYRYVSKTTCSLFLLSGQYWCSSISYSYFQKVKKVELACILCIDWAVGQFLGWLASIIPVTDGHVQHDCSLLQWSRLLILETVRLLNLIISIYIKHFWCVIHCSTVKLFIEASSFCYHELSVSGTWHLLGTWLVLVQFTLSLGSGSTLSYFQKNQKTVISCVSHMLVSYS